tara:strand:+ start:867 stop:2381 length:1515 start_codon:yes stop_codon:yes gene_type:complete
MVSKIEVDKIDPQSGTTLEVGSSGDTVNVPSGATLDINSGATIDATGATITGFDAASDEKVKVSSDDTTPGFLNGKLVAGTDISLTEGSGGGDETLTLAFTGTGKDIDWQAVQTSSPITGVAGKGYPINTTSGAITINLPAGTVGDQITVLDYAGTFDTNELTISADGSEKIKGSTTDQYMTIERQAGTLVYVDSTQGWVLMSAAPDPGFAPPTFITATGGTITTVDTDYKVHTFTGDGTFEVTALGNAAGSNTIDYLIIGGGGGGGSRQHGAAGGAGGYRFNYPNPATGGTPVAVTTYPIDIGGGGAGGTPAVINTDGVVGDLSSGFSISSAGGGFGGKHATAGGAGGSGGGGGSARSGGTGNTPPVSPSQGYAGGAGGACTNSGSGGGGGASQVGAAAVGSYPSSQGGDGGDGSPSTINGSNVTRGGGGGGSGTNNGTNSPPTHYGTGGAGGGGDSGHAPDPSSADTAGSGDTNTGGGGGAGGTGCGGAGGSGIVIIRYKFQ